jgi:hypothetical protein
LTDKRQHDWDLVELLITGCQLLSKCNDQSEKNQANDTLCLAVSRASDLCNDLEDEENLVSDVDVQIPQVVSREKKQRKRKSYDKKNVRRSNRVRVKPSKLQ